MAKLCIIQVRGSINVSQKEKDTLKMLNLFRKHNCVVVDKNSVYDGMIKKVGHLLTWGEINKDTLKELIIKRGEISKGNKVTEKYLTEKVSSIDKYIDELMEGKKKLKDAGIKPVFRLAPPVKGFEDLGIKKSFKKGGVLGYRGEKINDLVKKMM